VFCASYLGAQSPLSINSDRIETVAGRGLLVRTKPAGAVVYIDGIERGRTPLTIQDMRSGDYVIRVFKTGYRERELRIRLSEGSCLELDLELHELAGRIFVNVRREQGASGDALPFNPELLIDGDPPLDAENFPGAVDWSRPGPRRPPAPEPRRDYRGGARQTRPAGNFPGGAAYLVNAIPASSSLWIYELYVPAGFRQIRIRAFGWKDAQASLLVEPDRTESITIRLSPADFSLSGGRLSRPVFNPENAGALGSTSLSFEVSAPGSGTFSVMDQGGNQIYHRRLPSFTTWSQRVSWDGRDEGGKIPGEGPYTLRVEAYPSSAGTGVPAGQIIRRQVVIDSSLLIYPLTLSGAMPGLFYTPSPELLPPRSFQMEASLLFGQVPAVSGSGAPANTFGGAGIPFDLGFRFSPLRRLELSAALGNSAPDDEPPWGFSVAAKWLAFKSVGQPAGGAAAPLSLALLCGFSWASLMERTPQREGASLMVPMSWEFGPGLSLFFSPGLFWPGWDQPEPRLVLSLGPYVRRGIVSAGLSLRGEFDMVRPPARKGGALGEGPAGVPSGDGPPSPVTLFTAAEVKLLPPPSNIVLTVLGGFWNRGTELGGFGGFALGTIF
jgi:hypothetical protein